MLLGPPLSLLFSFSCWEQYCPNFIYYAADVLYFWKRRKCRPI